MGNTFGYYPESGFNLYFKPDVTPDPKKDPTFDPNLGFESGRKERVMIATEEEMVSAKLPVEDRDYCAHLLLKYQACWKKKMPLPVFCEHEKHEYAHCKFEDHVIRMKEYERERRLLIRQKKMEQREAAEALGA